MLIEKDHAKAEKQKKDQRKEEEQQIAVGYRFRIFGKANIPIKVKPKSASTAESRIARSGSRSNSPAHSRSLSSRKSGDNKEGTLTSKNEMQVELPFELDLMDYLPFIHAKQMSELMHGGMEDVVPDTAKSTDPTPRGFLSRRRQEKNGEATNTKKPSGLFDMVLSMDNRMRDQIDRDISKRLRERVRSLDRNIHDSQTLPSVLHSTTQSPHNPYRSDSSSSTEEELLRRKRSELRMLTRSSLLSSKVDPSHPLFYIFRVCFFVTLLYTITR